MKIIYEPHPISVERKSELRAQGYTILDARFAPKERKKPVENKQAGDLGAMSAEDLHELAKSEGIKVVHNAGADKVREAILKARE